MLVHWTIWRCSHVGLTRHIFVDVLAHWNQVGTMISIDDTVIDQFYIIP